MAKHVGRGGRGGILEANPAREPLETGPKLSFGHGPSIPGDRVLISCVVPDREPYRAEAELLFKSVIAFGGELGRAQRVALFVESADPETASRLNDMGVTVKTCAPVDDWELHANKIRALSGEEDYDVLVVLDCDTVVARDFSSFLDGEGVAACPNARDPLGIELWERLFGYFGLELPAARYREPHQLGETIPYFNSGVLIVPRRYTPQLAESWTRHVHELPKAYAALPDIRRTVLRGFREDFILGDQIALSLALAAERIPHRALPVELNFPTHHTWVRSFGSRDNTWDPYVLHYHHRRLHTGEVLPSSRYHNVNDTIRELNRCLFGSASRGRLATSFSTALGWLHHYNTRRKKVLRRLIRRWSYRDGVRP